MGIIGNRFVSDFSFEVSIVVCGAGFEARPAWGPGRRKNLSV